VTVTGERDRANSIAVRRIKVAIASACPSQDAFALAHLRLRMAAAILYVTAQRQTPDPAVIDGLRDHAMDAIFESGAEKSA
jgi:hypothetical protein